MRVRRWRDPGPATDGQAAPSRRRRWVKRVAWAVLVGLVVCTLGVVLLWVATPSVSDAPSRVRAILAAHDAPSDGGVPPARVSQALVATEDSRFYSDHGLDPKSLVRGLFSFVRGGPLEGATLDAQLAKLLYGGGHFGPWATLEEAVLAVKIDNSFGKRQILSMYLDAAYFGHGAYGVTAAARTFFALPANQLSWAQASMLAGLVNAPSAYDPTSHLHLAKSRQRHVLSRLVAMKTLTAAQADAIFGAALHPAIPFSG